MSQNKQVAAAIGRVPHLDLQELKTLRENALRFGEDAAPLFRRLTRAWLTLTLPAGSPTTGWSSPARCYGSWSVAVLVNGRRVGQFLTRPSSRTVIIRSLFG